MWIRILFCTLVSMVYTSHDLPTSKRAQLAIATNTPKIAGAFKAKDLQLGGEVFVRVFKQEKELEIWVKKEEKFEHFKTYPICYFSGELGPKTKQGDLQAPEGFYYVKPNALNPNSNFHLSFNLGYPNQYDRAHGFTGNYLMVHGSCVSVGCYAMTDPLIEEIYTIVHAALKQGQPLFRVHCFPFKMTDANMENHVKNVNYEFWGNLKDGYDWFEEKRVPPNVEVKNMEYVFD